MPAAAEAKFLSVPVYATPDRLAAMRGVAERLTASGVPVSVTQSENPQTARFANGRVAERVILSLPKGGVTFLQFNDRVDSALGLNLSVPGSFVPRRIR